MDTPGADPGGLRQGDDARVLRDCRWEAFRASGPGGQKRNKTSSAVRLVHGPTGLSAIANESRSQAKNRAKALERLRHRLILAARDPSVAPALAGGMFCLPSWWAEVAGPRHPRAGAGTAARLGVSPRHPRYRAVMGLVLDVLAADGGAVSAAAQRLGLTTANLVRFLQHDEALLAHVNRERAAAGLKPLGARE